MEEKIQELRALLADAGNISQALMEEGVELTFEIGSDVKTVSVPAKTTIEFSVKGKVNKEL